MSPLEAARQMLEKLGYDGPQDRYELPYTQSSCSLCDASTSEFFNMPHEPACPWLAMPRIVAALEAAERVVQAHEDPANDLGDGAAWIPSTLIDALGTAPKGEEGRR